MSRTCNTDGRFEKSVQILVRKPEGKRPVGRPRRRWDGNIGTDLMDIGREAVDWIALAESRDQWRALMDTVMKLRVP
jgi:hypothetical protein